MKRILLTGASGFVGSHVLRHFLKNTNWEIVCPVTYKHKGIPDRIIEQLKGLDESRVKIIRYDLRDEITQITSLRFGKINYVVNLASESHVDRSITDPKPFIENNIQLILNVLEYCRKTKPEKILHISTDEVYGPAPKNIHHREWIDQYFPSNPYSSSKAAQESICYAYWRTYGLPIAITNTMNIFGEMQDTEKFIPLIIKKVLSGDKVFIHGDKDGNSGSRYYLHARNQADALLYILENIQFFKYGESEHPVKYHVVGEKEVNNLEMALFIADYIGKPLNYEVVDFHSSRPGHDLRYALDGSKLSGAGWKPPLKFESSLKKTIDWYLNNREWI